MKFFSHSLPPSLLNLSTRAGPGQGGVGRRKQGRSKKRGGAGGAEGKKTSAFRIARARDQGGAVQPYNGTSAFRPARPIERRGNTDSESYITASGLNEDA